MTCCCGGPTCTLEVQCYRQFNEGPDTFWYFIRNATKAWIKRTCNGVPVIIDITDELSTIEENGLPVGSVNGTKPYPNDDNCDFCVVAINETTGCRKECCAPPVSWPCGQALHCQCFTDSSGGEGPASVWQWHPGIISVTVTGSTMCYRPFSGGGGGLGPGGIDPQPEVCEPVSGRNWSGTYSGICNCPPLTFFNCGIVLFNETNLVFICSREGFDYYVCEQMLISAQFGSGNQPVPYDLITPAGVTVFVSFRSLPISVVAGSSAPTCTPEVMQFASGAYGYSRTYARMNGRELCGQYNWECGPLNTGPLVAGTPTAPTNDAYCDHSITGASNYAITNVWYGVP